VSMKLRNQVAIVGFAQSQIERHAMKPRAL
jgi:hypothetical protein